MEKSKPIRLIDLFNNDLYEFTCSYAYFKQNKHQQIATFEVFFRKYPFKGEYVIFGGLESVKNFIKNLRFTEEHEKYLKNIFPHIEDQYFIWLKQDFSNKILLRGMKEGQIIFANEPLLSYSGPLGFIQLFQTPCLNLIGFSSLVATNASRMAKAVYPKKCIQFGTRRAQGPDGALTAAQYAYIGGFVGTSNVSCGQKLQVECVGTMSHAYVTAFNSLNDVKQFFINGVDVKRLVIQKSKQFGFKTHEGQLASFLNFAYAFPNNFTTLIDTYSTLDSGILNTIIVASALIQCGITQIGVRLDSGDLGMLSIQCRKIWNYHIPDVRLTIVASDDLYEERLIELMQNKCEIDIFAIGTNIATCKKQPALGVVCKLVELDGVPKMKLSSSIEKATYPCFKNIYRIEVENGVKFDLIALNNEHLEATMEIEVGTIKNPNLETIKIKQICLINDQIDMNYVSIKTIKSYVQKSRNQLPKQIFELECPSVYKVLMTKNYLKQFHKTHDKATKLISVQQDKPDRIPFKQIQLQIKQFSFLK